MTDDELHRRAHDEFSWAGFTTEHHHDLARRALEAFPDDPFVIYHCLDLWSYFAMPVGQDYSSVGPTRAEGRVLLDRALAAGQRVLDANPVRDTVPLHALFFWVTELRALDRIVKEPSTDQLAKAGAELDAVFEELTHFENERKAWNALFRYQTLARRRSWELLRSAPAYPQELRDRIAGYIRVFDSCARWPIAPLARDAAFQAHITAELAARTAAKSHPAPVRDDQGSIATMWLKEYLLDAPDEAELIGRLRLLLWLGVDEAMFTCFASQAIEERAPRRVLEVLLGLGFDPSAVVTSRRNKPVETGYTLLHEAIAEDHAEAVRMLVAAGADPARKNKPARGDKTKKQSPLELAKTRKKKAIIDALENKVAAPTHDSTELATKLRAAAQAMKPADLAWCGSTFGVSVPDPVKAVEAVLARSPETAAQILADLGGTFVFERYLVARALRAAGYVIDRTLKSPAFVDGDLTVTGDLHVDGALVDDLGGSTTVVAGDVHVGSLLTESDMIVGGSLHASEIVWGHYNDGSLVVEGEVQAPILVMTDHTFEQEGKRRVGTELVDPDDDELAKIFVPGAFDDGSLDRERVVKLAKKKVAFLHGKRAAKPKPKPKVRPATTKKPTARRARR